MTAKDNIGAIFDVLANNTQDVEKIVQQFGGIGNLIRAAPSLFRIMKTISDHREPVEEAERVAKTLYYSNETRERVSDFQRKHGLRSDGIVGNETWSAVEQLLAHMEQEDD